MINTKIQSIGRDILTLLHYDSFEAAGREMVYLSARSKLSRYRAEEQQYETKYGLGFDEFRLMVESKKNEEDFEEEDDLMSWRFAHETAGYLTKKVQELSIC
jgi:hypothetical protein